MGLVKMAFRKARMDLDDRVRWGKVFFGGDGGQVARIAGLGTTAVAENVTVSDGAPVIVVATLRPARRLSSTVAAFVSPMGR